MRRTIFAAVPLAVLALAAPAAADGGRHATTYKATLTPAAAAPEATATKHGREVADGVRGKAQLVDGPRRDMVRLHARGLAAGESYSWSVRRASAGGDACAGEVVDAFAYEAIDARRRGHGRERARSRDFAAEDGASYAVVVTAADGADVACGEFATRASRRRSAKAERKRVGHEGGKHRGKGRDGGAFGQGDDSDEDSVDEDSASEDSAGEDSADEDSAGDDPADEDSVEDDESDED